MGKNIKDEFEILKKNISEILAPALLAKMEELNYRRCTYYDDAGAEYGISIDHILDAINNPKKIFTPYHNQYDTPELKEDRQHRVIIDEFHNMQRALQALVKRKQDAIDASRWIEELSVVSRRKVIIEKMTH